MSKNTPKKIIRKTGIRHYRKIFWIFPEGKTEKNYLNSLITNKNVTLKIIHKNSISSPQNLFKYALHYLEKNKKTLKKYDHEIWVIIDREDNDKRPHQEIEDLYLECNKQGYNLAISNPALEYWLLLHFEDGNKITSSKQCIDRLKKYVPDYNKPKIPKQLQGKAYDAISRAKEKNNPADKWPKTNGTTIYLLIEKII
ncbi:MAG: RloB family protein [Gammaproteobacteria bacterium]|jgi:hypothetical protein